MKIGPNDLVFIPVHAGTASPPAVRVQQRFMGAKVGEVSMTIDQARQMAAEILLAADVAEGKA